MPPETEKDVPMDGHCLTPPPQLAIKKSVIITVNPVILLSSNRDFVLVIFVESVSSGSVKNTTLYMFICCMRASKVCRAAHAAPECFVAICRLYN